MFFILLIKIRCKVTFFKIVLQVMVSYYQPSFVVTRQLLQVHSVSKPEKDVINFFLFVSGKFSFQYFKRCNAVMYQHKKYVTVRPGRYSFTPFNFHLTMNRCYTVNCFQGIVVFGKNN